MNAETETPSPVRRSRSQASMGPRSHERGNNTGRGVTSKTSGLQWGRVLMNAETPHALWPSRLRGLRFNGAAFS